MLKTFQCLEFSLNFESACLVLLRQPTCLFILYLIFFPINCKTTCSKRKIKLIEIIHSGIPTFRTLHFLDFSITGKKVRRTVLSIFRTNFCSLSCLEKSWFNFTYYKDELRKTKTRTENTNRVASSDFLLSIHLFVSCIFCKRQLNRSSTLLLKSKKAQSYVAFRVTYFFITGKQKREPTS